MTQNKALSMIGIAMKAGKIVSGGFAVEQGIKSGDAKLVIIAEDASPGTSKKFLNMSHFYEIPALQLGTKESLGKAVGREYRSIAAALDAGLAEAILKQAGTTRTEQSTTLKRED